MSTHQSHTGHTQHNRHVSEHKVRRIGKTMIDGHAGAAHRRTPVHHHSHHKPRHRKRHHRIILSPGFSVALALLTVVFVVAMMRITIGGNYAGQSGRLATTSGAQNGFAQFVASQVPNEASKQNSTSQSSVQQAKPSISRNVNSSHANYTGTLPNSTPPNVSGNYTYYYAGGRQYVNAAGVTVNMTQHQPIVSQSPGSVNHSLMELAAQSTDGKQIIEVGWTVDPALNVDTLPRLFVYHWVSGQTSCYNGCGFVRTSPSIGPGSTVVNGTTATFGIVYSGGNWNILYNGTTIGYYPASLWGNGFTQIGYVQVFGEAEISSNSTTKCIQMGNGLGGKDPNSASISNFTLISSTTSPALSPFATSGSPYSYGFAGPTGLHIGGPGIC